MRLPAAMSAGQQKATRDQGQKLRAHAPVGTWRNGVEVHEREAEDNGDGDTSEISPVCT